ncbi:MAG: hypothetical protein ACK4FJ_06105 [Ferrovibrio sp.]|uniref:hypothetical protein n=1 Tax=Ferrovibrio sp. TaxID=1917215 RepID=UPI0039194758
MTHSGTIINFPSRQALSAVRGIPDSTVCVIDRTIRLREQYLVTPAQAIADLLHPIKGWRKKAEFIDGVVSTDLMKVKAEKFGRRVIIWRALLGYALLALEAPQHIRSIHQAAMYIASNGDISPHHESASNWTNASEAEHVNLVEIMYGYSGLIELYDCEVYKRILLREEGETLH